MGDSVILEGMYEREAFNPKNYISVGVSERDVEMYKEVFDLFDIHRCGSLTPNDLRNALEMFGYHPKKHLIYQIISDIDQDESGGLDFREFLNIMTDQTRPCDEDTQEDYERVFTYFDIEGHGTPP
jgi:centrin-1